MKKIFTILKLATENWSNDRASHWAAALSFYTLLCVGPVLFLAVKIAGVVFGEEAAHRGMFTQAGQLMGHDAARTLSEVMQRTAPPMNTVTSTVIGIGILLFTASTLFAALQDAMNAMWHVRPVAKSGIWLVLRQRFLSVSMILGLSFLLMVSLVMDSGIAAIWDTFGKSAGEGHQVGQFFSAWVVGTALLAGTSKYLPEVQLPWGTALMGAVATALMLNLGKMGIGIYLGESGVTAAYGAAGSLSLVLFWVYYAAQVLFFGAALTRVLGQQTGQVITASDQAEKVETVPARSKEV
jgi:membrane protein